jgi:hypothetical protein
METLNNKKEFQNSFKGLFSIISDRKLYKKPVYSLSGFFIILMNIVFFFFKDLITSKDYFELLKIYVTIFLPPFITFCGFTMTAYSLVVGFLNYGVFKSTIEKFYSLKIKTEKSPSKDNLPKFSVYQKAIALFALAILVLLATVGYFLIIKLFTEIEFVVKCDKIEYFNAINLLLLTLLTNYCFILIVYNIVNIFTLSQSLNKLIYKDELEKLNKD